MTITHVGVLNSAAGEQGSHFVMSILCVLLLQGSGVTLFFCGCVLLTQSQEEDDELSCMVQSMKELTGRVGWAAISKAMSTPRTGKQCRER